MENIYSVSSPLARNKGEGKQVKITNPQDSEGSKINIFKKINVPNFEKIITSSQSIFSDFLNFAGELWHKEPENSEEKPLERRESESSSVLYEESSSEVIVLHRLSVNTGIHNFQVKPKKIKNSKSFATPGFRAPHLLIEDDVMVRVEPVKNQSLIDSHPLQRRISEYGNYLCAEANPRSSLKQNISLFPNSIYQNNSILETSELDLSDKKISKLLSLRIENEVQENSENSESENKDDDNPEEYLHKKNNYSNDKTSEILNKHMKSNSTNHQFKIPNIIKIRHKSINTGPSIINEVYDPKAILETNPDYQENKISIKNENSLEKKLQSLSASISENSLGPYFSQIPKSVLYQIPILTFEEFIGSLMNYKIKDSDSILWQQNWLNRLCNCCSSKLNDEDAHVCEQLIAFSMNKFNFQNSFHLILILSCFNSVTKADRWPVKDDDWYEMGFEANGIDGQLENYGSLTLLHIFFLSTYFSNFYQEMLRVRRYYSFDLYNVISSISEVTLDHLREKKLNRTIKHFGSGLEVVFFYFVGVLLYWFKGMVRCKDYASIWKNTVEKAKSSSSELIQEAWKVYLNKNNEV
ncbi:hypothetical protein SteCoe_9831 [Stentor coeruleus]|uniref:ELMO domain-containing protein n=1 Tax=Stentor coeruleus TaxID=5963 RepID=A0A1R2CGX0_9CILI|nr:hypothetical protein SteCoe_9831 [Stentor coeruleus]